MGKKYYAVVRGNVKKPTIFTSWSACKKVVIGYSKSKFKGFDNYEDALNYIKNNTGVEGPIPINNNSETTTASQPHNRKYYTVFDSNHNVWIIYDSPTPAKKIHAKSDKNILKKFNTFDKAWAFASDNKDNTLPILKIKDKKKAKNVTTKPHKRICPICEKPHSGRTKCCVLCNKKKKEHGATIGKLLNLRKIIGVEDIFAYLEDNPQAMMRTFNKDDVAKDKNEVLSQIQSTHYKRGQFIKWEGDYPLYIKQLFLKKPTIEFQTLSGSVMNPNIHFRCLACDEEHVTNFKNSNFSHNCLSTKSSGEVAVEELLRNKCHYLTQFNTLKCLNPITGRQLPYDFELPEQKIIIEVQGHQHYKYIPHFHGSEMNFEYQTYKDNVKRKFAELNGYKVVYINYIQIENGQFKLIIQDMI